MVCLYMTELRTSICNGLAAIEDSKLGVWGKTPKMKVWGEVRGSRVVPIDSPPTVCLYIKEFRTSICNGLAAIDDSKLGVWGKPPKRGFGLKLGGRELYQSIGRLWFAYI